MLSGFFRVLIVAYVFWGIRSPFESDLFIRMEDLL